MSIDTILLVIAALCFLAAAVNVKVGSLDLTAAGLFCWILSVLL